MARVRLVRNLSGRRSTPVMGGLLVVGATVALVLATFVPDSAAHSASAANAPKLTAKCPGFPNYKMEPVGHRGGSVVEGHPTALGSLSPLAGGFESWEFPTPLIFDKLVNVNPANGGIYPELASQVPSQANGGITSGGRTYTFHLRAHVKWADGKPFTASDVAYNYKLLANPQVGSPFTSAVNASIASVSARGALTVVFHLKAPDAAFLYDDMYEIAPEHILDRYAPSAIANSPFAKGDPNQTFGTGPFRFGSIHGGNTLILNRNPLYFCGVPALDHYVYVATAGGSTTLQLLESGQINLAQISPSDLPAAQAAGLKTFKYLTVFSTNLLFNLSSGHPTGDRRVRQALMYGMDRTAALAGGYAQTTNGQLAPRSFAYTNKITPAYTYSPTKAEQLLKAAGWTRKGSGPLEKNGQPLRIELWTNSGNRTRDTAATVLQQEWQALGVQVDVNLEDFTALTQRFQSSKDYDVIILGLQHDLDPNDLTQYYGSRGALNYNGYRNPKVDALLKQGTETSDPAKRKVIYTTAQNLIAQDVPMPALWFNGNVRAESQKVHNVVPNGIALDVNRWNAAWWWVTS